MISRQTMLNAALTLPPQERVDLVNEIWDSLATDPVPLKLTAAQEAELERCWRDYLADPKAGDDWPTTRQRIIGGRA
jgi:putative addiction module component (TIGR02574 family)